MTSTNGKPDRREMLTALGGAAAAAAVVVSAASKVQARSTTLSFLVDRYRAYYHSAPQYGWEARIYLYSAGPDQSCVLYFVKEDEAMPANTVSANGNSANVYFRSGRLAEIREFLRKRAPRADRGCGLERYRDIVERRVQVCRRRGRLAEPDAVTNGA